MNIENCSEKMPMDSTLSGDSIRSVLGVEEDGDATSQLYVCDICGKGGFSGKHALAGHKSVHSREEHRAPTKSEESTDSGGNKGNSRLQYHCIVCGKPFGKKSRLEEHENNHWKYPYYLLENEKPTCKLCGDQLSKFAFHRHKCFLGAGDGFMGVVTKVKNSKSEKIYDCNICGKSYTLYLPFKQHLITHDVNELPPEKMRYRCKICQKEFAKKYNYENHLRIHTGEKPFLCDFCGKGFRRKGDLHRHKKFHNGDRQHTCDICQRSFFCKWDLMEHRNVHMGEQQFQCEICGKTFNRKRTLRAHHETHLKKGEMVKSQSRILGKTLKPAEATVTLADKSYENETRLRLNFKFENNAKNKLNFSNIMPPKASNKRMGLFDVINQTMKDENLLKSENDTLTTGPSLQDATLLLDMHAAVSESVKKHESDRNIFASINFSMKDKKDETNEDNVNVSILKEQPTSARGGEIEQDSIPQLNKSHQCSECGKQYMKKSSLRSHIALVHADSSPVKYPCEQCNKVFSRKYSYEKHLMKHSGERPYLCSSCGKGFVTNGDLNRHLQFHTGEKPHQCDQCDRAFTCKWDLEEHYTIHTGVKNHTCNICGKKFGRKRSLRCHKKTHEAKEKIKVVTETQ